MPKIVILREFQVYEESKVNSATKRSSKKQEMELLFVNLLREYMELEYEIVRKQFKHPFSIERIIDDFILLAFFIGNDFLHKLYCMNTKKGNFDEVIEIFKQTLSGLDGYITDRGDIDWNRFLTLLKKVEKLEPKMIQDTLKEMEMFLKGLKRTNYKLVMSDEEYDEEIDEFKEGAEEHIEKKKPPRKRENESDEEESGDEAILNEEFDEGADENNDYTNVKPNQKNYELEHRIYYKKIKEEVNFIENVQRALRSENNSEIADMKGSFYKKFFDMENIDQLKNVCKEYMKGIQFVMHYYFRGWPSWTWFYPYFMSPFLSDLVAWMSEIAKTTNFDFEPSVPLEPFSQLAYILPKASLILLPPIYEEVLTKSHLTKEYYPDSIEFEPFDGIKDYMWIAKVDVINDQKMNSVLSQIDKSKITPDELNRNQTYKNLVFKYNKEATRVKVVSPIKGINDFEVALSIREFETPTEYPFDHSKVTHDLAPDLKMDGYP